MEKICLPVEVSWIVPDLFRDEPWRDWGCTRLEDWVGFDWRDEGSNGLRSVDEGRGRVANSEVVGEGSAVERGALIEENLDVNGSELGKFEGRRGWSRDKSNSSSSELEGSSITFMGCGRYAGLNFEWVFDWAAKDKDDLLCSKIGCECIEKEIRQFDESRMKCRSKSKTNSIGTTQIQLRKWKLMSKLTLRRRMGKWVKWFMIYRCYRS